MQRSTSEPRKEIFANNWHGLHTDSMFERNHPGRGSGKFRSLPSARPEHTGESAIRESSAHRCPQQPFEPPPTPGAEHRRHTEKNYSELFDRASPPARDRERADAAHLACFGFQNIATDSTLVAQRHPNREPSLERTSPRAPQTPRSDLCTPRGQRSPSAEATQRYRETMASVAFGRAQDLESPRVDYYDTQPAAYPNPAVGGRRKPLLGFQEDAGKQSSKSQRALTCADSRTGSREDINSMGAVAAAKERFRRHMSSDPSALFGGYSAR